MAPVFTNKLFNKIQNCGIYIVRKLAPPGVVDHFVYIFILFACYGLGFHLQAEAATRENAIIV